MGSSGCGIIVLMDAGLVDVEEVLRAVASRATRRCRPPPAPSWRPTW